MMLFLLHSNRRSSLTTADHPPLLMDVLILLQRPLVDAVQLRLGVVRLRQVMLQLVQVMPLLLLLLMLLQVRVSSNYVLLCLGATAVLRVAGLEVHHPGLIWLLREHLRGAMSICRPQNGAHEGVAGKQGTFRVDPRHDGRGARRHLTYNHLGVVRTLDVHASDTSGWTALGPFVAGEHHVILGRTFRQLLQVSFRYTTTMRAHEVALGCVLIQLSRDGTVWKNRGGRLGHQVGRSSW